MDPTSKSRLIANCDNGGARHHADLNTLRVWQSVSAEQLVELLDHVAPPAQFALHDLLTRMESRRWRIAEQVLSSAAGTEITLALNVGGDSVQLKVGTRPDPEIISIAG